MLFAKKIVSEFYKLFLKKVKQIFLDDTLEILTKVNLPPEERFCGNTLGYNEYNLSNGKICLTALEQKSWMLFLNFLSIKNPDHVAHIDPITAPFYKTLKTKLKSMSKEDFTAFDKHKQCFYT